MSNTRVIARCYRQIRKNAPSIATHTGQNRALRCVRFEGSVVSLAYELHQRLDQTSIIKADANTSAASTLSPAKPDSFAGCIQAKPAEQTPSV